MITVESLRTPYTAVEQMSVAVSRGDGAILSAEAMIASHSNKNQAYLDSVRESLNTGVNELADVLHRFWLNEVH